MANGQENQRTRFALFSRAGWILLTLAFLAAIALDILFSETGILHLWELELEYKNLYQETLDLEAENERLEEMIELLRDGTEGVEKIAREELGLAKPGEVIYLFPEMSKAEK